MLRNKTDRKLARYSLAIIPSPIMWTVQLTHTPRYLFGAGCCGAGGTLASPDCPSSAERCPSRISRPRVSVAKSKRQKIEQNKTKWDRIGRSLIIKQT